MMKPKLQVALDTPDLDRALDVAAQTRGIADRIEVGTPLLRRHGMRAIEAVRKNFSEAVLVADSKIMDYGDAETIQSIEAGASGVIVQGVAPIETIEAVCLTAQRLGAFAMVDCIGVADIRGLAAQLRGLPVSHLIVHRSRDEQQAMGSIQASEVLSAVTDAEVPPIAVAGGIAPSNVAKLVPLHMIDTIIVGQAIVASESPRDVAHRLLAAWTEEFRWTS
jgi:3-hexulose-6-phosphate synthase / 6-phospho-3-hexuloisomerase